MIMEYSLDALLTVPDPFDKWLEMLGLITEQIYVGSCIQTEADVETLSNAAVRGATPLT